MLLLALGSITASNRRFQDDLTAQGTLNETNKLDTVQTGEFDAIFYPGGHGPAALIKAAESNSSLLKGKRVTGYSNAEEALVLKGDNIPFMLEDRLKELGADHQKATVPFIAHTEVDGLLITGQNPLSAGPTAQELIEVLEEKTVMA
jgi:putative intracellular protease/amidase